MKENYTIKGKKYQDLDDHWLKWELMKMEIWGLTIAYWKNKTKTQRKRESDLQSHLQELDRRILLKKWLCFTNKKRKA